jgi:ABC-type glycerol-3-phosphate transport system permease component
MKEASKHQILNFLIASVWFINGVFCKVFNLVPRHQEIVGKILGNDHAKLFTLWIGIFEAAMAAWILSRLSSKLNAVVQILVVAFMNTLEFILVPNLLLWGRVNAFFALIFILLIFYNEFGLNRKLILNH